MKICCYGSLKQGFWNHRRFNLGGFFVGKDEVENVALYLTTAPYPFAVEESGADVEVEVYDVPANVFASINWMEVSAGYYRKDLMTAYGPASIWLVKEPPHGAQKFEGKSWNGECLP